MARVRERAAGEVIHYLGSEVDLNVVTHYSYRQRFVVDRPDHGARVGQLTCQSCGAAVGYRVFALRETRHRRYRRIAIGALGLALLAAGLVDLVVTAADDVADDLSVFGYAAILVGFFVGIGYLTVGLKDQGIARARDPRSSGHRIEPADDRRATTPAPPAAWPPGPRRFGRLRVLAVPLVILVSIVLSGFLTGFDEVFGWLLGGYVALLAVGAGIGVATARRNR